jgi:tripartite-type tricarboxylate transporter receptor subunit TctC
MTAVINTLNFLFRTIVVALAAGLSATPALAQETPLPKLIKIIVPFSPGASNDLFGRALAQRMSARLGTTVIVENRPGAGGAIGADAVARGEPDGSVLLFSSNSFTTNAAITPKLPYDMNKSFVPVAMIARTSMIFVVNANSPYKTLPQAIEAMRDPKLKLNYGSAGVGSLAHIATELFHTQAGTTALHIPYKGVSNAIADMIGDNIQIMISTVASVGEQIKAGKLRALAVTSLDRSKAMPEVRTVDEYIPGYTVEAWWGVFAPGGTPKPIVDRLNTIIRTITEQSDMRKLFAQESAEPVPMTPAEFNAYYTSEISRWKTVVRERNLSSAN